MLLTEVISVDQTETADMDSLARRLEKQVQMMQTDVIWVRCSKVTAPFWCTLTAEDTRHFDVHRHGDMSRVTRCSCHGFTKCMAYPRLPFHWQLPSLYTCMAAESTVLWPTCCCHSLITGTISTLNDTSKKYMLSVLVQPVTRRTNRDHMCKSKRWGDWPMSSAITPCVNMSITHAGLTQCPAGSRDGRCSNRCDVNVILLLWYIIESLTFSNKDRCIYICIYTSINDLSVLFYLNVYIPTLFPEYPQYGTAFSVSLTISISIIEQFLLIFLFIINSHCVYRSTLLKTAMITRWFTYDNL